MLGDLLPVAVGVAISPIPIIAVILMPLAPQARWDRWRLPLGLVRGRRRGHDPCTALAAYGLGTGERVIAVVVFTAIAVSTVAVPVVAYAVAADRMRSRLDELRAWLQAHNAAVMASLLLVLGITLVGKGIGGL